VLALVSQPPPHVDLEAGGVVCVRVGITTAASCRPRGGRWMVPVMRWRQTSSPSVETMAFQSSQTRAGTPPERQPWRGGAIARRRWAAGASLMGHLGLHDHRLQRGPATAVEPPGCGLRRMQLVRGEELDSFQNLFLFQRVLLNFFLLSIN
jgi:hypothetical protein